MAERIVSPGVFTREKDLSFLPAGVEAIGAAIVGPTLKGPAFTPTVITSESEYGQIFGQPGDTDGLYVPMAVQRYLNGGAPSVTVVRVLGIGGYTADFVNVVLTGSTGNLASKPLTGKVLATLLPSRKTSGVGDLSGTRLVTDVSAVYTGSNVTPTASAASVANVVLSGSNVTAELVYAGFDGADLNQFSDLAQDNNKSAYLYKFFNQDSSVVSSANLAGYHIKLDSGSINFATGTNSFSSNGTANTWTGNSSFSFARTPYIQSQLQGGGRTNLFRVYTRGHGSEINKDVQVVISDIKAAADGNVSPGFAQFSLKVFVRNLDDDTKFDNPETFDRLTLDKESPNYFAQQIGDMFEETDSAGKITRYGNYPAKSKLVRVGDFSQIESLGASLKPLAPMGFAAVENPTVGGANVPTASFVTSSDSNGNFEDSINLGFDFASTNKVNQSYLSEIPATSTNGSNPTFSLENMKGTVAGTTGFANSATNLSLAAATNVRQRKFSVPFQWGFNGMNPGLHKAKEGDLAANNTFGFDCSTGTSSGSLAYKRALGTISDPDFIDINLLITPGIIHEYHSSISNRAISISKDRGDTFYIMDGSRWGRSVDNAVTDVASLDNNFVATYFPWVKIATGTGVDRWVPPSVVIGGVYSQNDSIGQEWFAPAGLNRGGISAIDVKETLTHLNRDTLYEGRVNPIAKFPQQGIAVFGQKTLQARPSALDRVNVRRLLINLKKFIASTSRFLVFEQNTSATRARFLNTVNPYLESVQQRSGLSAFRVVMDDTNNTPDVIDRNQLVGQIFVQPTRTAEFIVLDFVVLPTGAAFPE